VDVPAGPRWEVRAVYGGRLHQPSGQEGVSGPQPHGFVAEKTLYSLEAVLSDAALHLTEVGLGWKLEILPALHISSKRGAEDPKALIRKGLKTVKNRPSELIPDDLHSYSVAIEKEFKTNDHGQPA